MADSLHLIAATFDVRRLLNVAPRGQLGGHDADLDYVAHMAVDGVFGAGRLRPFFVEPERRGQVRILGYTDRGGDALRQYADSFADAELHAACLWDRFASRPMPAAFGVGTVLGFECRVCPTVRKARGSQIERPGAEVDAFIAAVQRVDAGLELDRAVVYGEWLRSRFDVGGADLGTVEMTQFQFARQTRRTQGDQRVRRDGLRPDATLRGSVTVRDHEAFMGLLARGVGRHRAFGYGMLRLFAAPC